MCSNPLICPSSFPQAYNATCSNGWIVTTGARCLEQSITGWHSAPFWPFACDNTCLHCYVLMWLFGHPLVWHVCFIWFECVIVFSYNDKLPVTSICNTINLTLRVLLSFFLAVYIYIYIYTLHIQANIRLVHNFVAILFCVLVFR